jgi:hypothetical protein
MNHLRFLLAFLVVLGSYGLSSGQDQQQPHLTPATAREWTGLIPGYQEPAGVETSPGVMTAVGASREPRPSDRQLLRQTRILGPDGKPSRSIVTSSIPSSSENAYRSPATSSGAIHAPQRNPRSFQPKPEVMNQRPRSSPDQQPAPTQDLFGGRNNPGDLIYACGSKGLAVDFVTGNCVASRGQQINPQNLYPPFTALPPKPEPHDLIMRCGVEGRSADVIAGRCM